MDTTIIDTTFDFRSDTPAGQDPDTWSPTLARYHHILWNKALPSGKILELSTTKAPFYHYYASDNKDSCLSSDAVIPSFQYLSHISELVTSEELIEFETIGYTIGGMMVFPAHQVDRKWSINQARECTGRISDRFDLTVECIRQFYGRIDEPEIKNDDKKLNPLVEVLMRYRDFFRLFEDFCGYVEFFHLQNLVSADSSTVNFFLPFNGFDSPAKPQDWDEYHEHMANSIRFIESRNERIKNWATTHLR